MYMSFFPKSFFDNIIFPQYKMKRLFLRTFNKAPERNGFRFSWLMLSRTGRLMVLFGSLLLCVYLLNEAGNAYPKEQSYISLRAWNRTTSPLMHGKHTCIFRDVPPMAAEEWQLRAPYFVVLGVQKSGTRSLGSYLMSHPDIYVPRPEIHFFDGKFDNYTTEEGVLVKEAREKYSQEMFKPIYEASVEGKVQYYGMDSTPAYVFYSDRVPSRLFCVAPWVKLILLLRNPVDRAYSQYIMQKVERSKGFLDGKSFEHYVEEDMSKLKAAGAIREWKDEDDFRSFSGSQEEMIAWETYVDSVDSHVDKRYIGRGLYALQLRHWFNAMDTFGKPRSDLLVLHSDDMKDNTGQMYRKILKFLGIREGELTNYSIHHKGQYDAPLSSEMRSRLEAFYEPYNRQLYDMLGSEWEGVWG